MKGKLKKTIVCVLFAFLYVLFLCSFGINSSTAHRNENIYLQNEVIYKVTNEENEEKSDLNLFFAHFDDEYGISDTTTDILDKFLEILPEDTFGFYEEIFEKDGGFGLFDFLLSKVSLERCIKSFSFFIAIAIFLSLCENLCLDSSLDPFIKTAACVSFVLPVLNVMKDVLYETEAAIRSGSDFFGELIPVLSSVMALGMKTNTAVVSAAVMNLSFSFISGVLLKNLIHIGILIFVLSLISPFDTGRGIDSVSRGIKGWFSFLIGFVSFVLVTVLAFQNLIISSKDSVILRSAKYAVSSMIPVVGSTVSGALSTLLSGVKYLSSTIGVLAVAALFSVMGMPLVILLFYRFCIGTCITLANFAGAAYAERFFTSLRGAVDTVTAVLASAIMVYVLEIVIFMKSFQGAF